MSDNSDSKDGRLYVVFLDSFGIGDWEHTPWMNKALTKGTTDTGPVYVTPVALGSIYTGMSPSDHGLPSVSRHGTDPRLRPAGKTLPEIAAESEKYDSVLNLGLPFIATNDVDPEVCETYIHHSEAMGQAFYAPEGVQTDVSVAGPAGDLSKPDENMDTAFEMRRDWTYQKFGMARNVAYSSDADVVFISYRLLDSYCHYGYTQTPDNPAFEETYRNLLLQEVDQEVKTLYECEEGSEVMVFGDHGAMELTNLFRANRWLIENGYLDVDMDLEFKQECIEKGVMEEDDAPGETITENSDFVEVNEEESVAIASDPFSGGITLLDGADKESVKEMIGGLEEQQGVERVFWSKDEWPDGDLIEECPDLYIERKPGTFVSGNLHPEKGGPELTRDGVHHPIGVYGSTLNVPTPQEPLSTEDLFEVICGGFLGLDPDSASVSASDSPARGNQRDVQEHLEDLGYL